MSLIICHNVALISFPVFRDNFLFSLPPFAWAQQKTPPEWRRHKTQNIDMKNCHTDGVVNILAFFNVVASRQISPHFESQMYGVFFGNPNFAG